MDAPRWHLPAGNRRGAFTLVTVLIILALLAALAVGFLASMAAERTAAVAYGATVRAGQTAQAGVDHAIAMLRQCFKAFPDSCTVWDATQSSNDTTNADGSHTSNAGTSLYYRALQAAPATADDNRPPMLTQGSSSADRRQIYVLPLVSGVLNAVGRPESAKSKALPILNASKPVAEQNFADLNAPRFPHDAEGWIGSPPGRREVDAQGYPAPTPIRAPWVEVKDASGTVNGRYAYWVEDESFKANINYAGLGSLAAPHQRRDNAGNPAAADPAGYIGPCDVDIAGLLKAVNDRGARSAGNPPPTADEATNAKALVETRLSYPTGLFPEMLGYKHAGLIDPSVSSPANPKPSAIADRLRFLTTTVSGGLNLSRHGSQRLNLNALIPPSAVPVAPDEAQSQVDQIVHAIRYHAPDFGQRFYRKSSASASAALNAMDVTPGEVGNRALIYLYKEAANIRDYIDKDSLPTVILADGKVAPAEKPLLSIDPAPWAMGKDAAPFIQEVAINFRGDVTGGQYTLLADYYIEVWNMSDKPVSAPAGDLGPSPFIRVANPAEWYGTFAAIPGGDREFHYYAPLIPGDNGPSLSTSRTDRAHPRDFEIDISLVVFPAGEITVITTDTIDNHAATLKYAQRSYFDLMSPDDKSRMHVKGCPWVAPGKSTYQGSMPRMQIPLSNPPAMATSDTIRMRFEDGVPSSLSSPSSDYSTDLVFGNSRGYIDSIAAIPMSYSGGATGFRFPDAKAPYAPLGGYLRGNWTNTSTSGVPDGSGPSAVGDPRANNEQLVFLKSDGQNDPLTEATRFKNYLQLAAHSPIPEHPCVPAPTGVLPTLGFRNYMSVRPNRAANPWPDFPPYYASPEGNPTAAELAQNAFNAPAIIANAPLHSIGQLGDVYDAARLLNSPGAIDTSRGGGRTLKIGQHDDRWDGDASSLSRHWTSWRLVDFFSIADHASQPRMIDRFAMEQPGLINLNGVARDGGAAVRAALMGFAFQPALAGGDPALASSASPLANVPDVQKIIDQMTLRISTPTKNPVTLAPNVGDAWQTGAGPFWERGELSELPLFGRTRTLSPANANATTDLTGIDLSSKVFDRGREELFRRLVEMVTTRGDTFTVYAVGQAVSQKTPAGPKTYSALQRLKVTFRLIPRTHALAPGGGYEYFHPGTDATGKYLPFNPKADAGLDQRIKERFDKPDHYDIQVLASTSGF